MQNLKLPSTIAFVITSRCNLRCKMCFQYGERAQKLKISGNAQLGNTKELKFSEIKTTINKINKYYPKKNKPELFITGGEAFTRPDMVEIIKYAASQGNKVTVNSNFALVNKKMAIELVKIDNYNPLVSIDGVGILHDTIRNVPGTYAKAMRNLNYFTSKGKKVTVCTTVTRYNVDHLVEIYHKLKHLNMIWHLKHVAWMPDKFAGIQNKMSQQYFNTDFYVYFPEKAAVPGKKIKILAEQLKELYRLKNKYGTNLMEIARPQNQSLYEHHCKFSLIQKDKVCKSPEVTILPDGMISFCNGGASGLGPLYANIMKDDFLTILEKRKPLEKIFNNLIMKNKVFPVCVKCSYLENRKFDKGQSSINTFFKFTKKNNYESQK